MQKQQLTLDAAYKFTLWYLLLCEAQSRQERRAVEDDNNNNDNNNNSGARVRNVASSLIRDFLPRRVLQNCCLSGACGRGSLTHKGIHFGRPEIRPACGERDDVCQCLAHATACVGRPVRLVLRDYSSSASLIGDRYGGLRCMLRHMDLQSVTVSGIPDQSDAQCVVEELGRTLTLRTSKLEHLSLGGIPAHVTISPLLSTMTRVDSVTELRLEDCGIQGVETIASYVKVTKHLRRLSLRGNHGICGGIRTLGCAVSSCCSLQFLDVGLCRLHDDRIKCFLSGLDSFVGRPSFTLDISNNLLSNSTFDHLRCSPVAFRAVVSELNLSGHNLENSGAAASAMLLEFPALCGILLDQCDLGPRDVQQLFKALSQKERCWSRLSLRGNGLTAQDIKRLSLVSFAVDSFLCVAGNSIGTNIHKLNLSSVLPLLSELDLSLCDIKDDGLLQLAAALEKVEPISLRVLRLDENGIGMEGKKGCGGLQFLGRALRASYAPFLEILSLSHNRLSLRPMLTLLEQVSSTLRELHLSYSSIANDHTEMTSLVAGISHRLKEGLGFEQLDVWALREANSNNNSNVFGFGAELSTWLERQRTVRIIVQAS